MSKLFSSLSVKGMTVRNRLVLPPMATSLAGPEGEVNRGHLEHYRARSAVGLAIVEHAYVDRQGLYRNGQLGVDADEKLSGLRQLAQTLEEGGAMAALQLAHAGSKTELEYPVGPSAVAHPTSGKVPRELSSQALQVLRRQYRQAARRCLEAGFPAVEVHGAHGYLLNQFLSPLTNHRQDEYGGSLEGRMRFPLEVAAAVRAELGPHPVLLFRLGADDGMEGGFTLEEAGRVARALVEVGVDVVDVSGGMQGYAGHGDQPAFFEPLARGVKAAVDVPVICTGGIKEPEVAEGVLERDSADLVGVGRALLADPDWVRKARLQLEGR